MSPIERIKQWMAERRQIRELKRNRVVVHTLEYEPWEMEYRHTIEYKQKEELPECAKPVTGKKKTYLVDYIDPEKTPEGFWLDDLGNEPRDRLNAIDLNLYMVNNDINEALLAGFKKNDMDLKKILIIGVVAVVLLVILKNVIT